MPLVYAHGVDPDSWMKIGALMAPIDEVYGASVGTFIGAWLGAIPIPLDWYVLDFGRLKSPLTLIYRDRDWQKWPVTIIAGAYAGWAIGKFVGRLVLYGKTIDLST
jgi:GPI ethanolamine phosphate transferase 2/3 subunit F